MYPEVFSKSLCNYTDINDYNCCSSIIKRALDFDSEVLQLLQKCS